MRTWNVGWGVISQCDMKCQFCYSKKRRTTGENLKLNDWITFIDANHHKIKSINYGTGENTLDKDWFKLVQHIRSNYPEIRQALTTNGHLAEAVKDDFCKEAFLMGIDEVDVSLDFPNKEKHNELRGQVKAFDWVMDTLQFCKENNVSTTIVFIGSRVNVTPENIDGIFAIAEKYSAIVRMNVYRPTEGLDEISEKFIISYDDIVGILKHIHEKYSILSLNDTLFSTILTNATIEDPSGDKSIRILADGSITPSTYLIHQDYVVANIKDENVLDVLEETSSLQQIIKKIIPEECSECVYKEPCAGGVYDRRYLWHNTLEKKDWYCPYVFKDVQKPIITISDTHFESVHDGYLPTMFFSPKKGG